MSGMLQDIFNNMQKQPPKVFVKMVFLKISQNHMKTPATKSLFRIL